MEEHTEPGLKKKKFPAIEAGLIALIVFLLVYKFLQDEEEPVQKREPLVVQMAETSTPPPVVEATALPVAEPTSVPVVAVVQVTPTPVAKPKTVKVQTPKGTNWYGKLLLEQTYRRHEDLKNAESVMK